MEVLGYVLTIEQTSFVPASTLFTTDELNDLCDRNDITFGSANRSLVSPDRFVEIDDPTPIGEKLRELFTLNLYLDLEN